MNAASIVGAECETSMFSVSLVHTHTTVTCCNGGTGLYTACGYFPGPCLSVRVCLYVFIWKCRNVSRPATVMCHRLVLLSRRWMLTLILQSLDDSTVCVCVCQE